MGSLCSHTREEDKKTHRLYFYFTSTYKRNLEFLVGYTEKLCIEKKKNLKIVSGMFSF